MVVQYLRVCQPAQETWVWFLVWRDSTYCLCTTTAEPCSLGTVLRNRSKSESHSVVSKSLRLHGLSNPWNSPGQNTGMGRVSLLQGIFPIQGSNPGIPHCRWILYQLSHKWSPRILKWVAYPFSSRPSQPRNRTGVSCIAGRFFTNEALKFLTNLICFSNKFFKSGSWWSPQNTANCLTHLFDHFNL